MLNFSLVVIFVRFSEIRCKITTFFAHLQIFLYLCAILCGYMQQYAVKNNIHTQLKSNIHTQLKSNIHTQLKIISIRD